MQRIKEKALMGKCYQRDAALEVVVEVLEIPVTAVVVGVG